MQKILAATTLSAVALASHSGSYNMAENTYAETYTQDYAEFNNDYYGYEGEQVDEVEEVEADVYGAWPPVNKFTTFKADVSLFQWNGKALVSYKGVTGTAKVDGDRSKIRVDATATLPVVGKVPAIVVADTKAGYSIEYVPSLKICQKTALPVKMDLKAFINKLYSETGGLTTYDGLVKPAWDSKQYNKFHSSVSGSQGHATLHSYIDTATHNGRWLQEESSAKDDPKIIVSVPNGEVKATFTDADFVISGCAPKAFTSEEERISIW
jgi:hypothetical protein